MITLIDTLVTFETVDGEEVNVNPSSISTLYQSKGVWWLTTIDGLAFEVTPGTAKSIKYRIVKQ